jgi:hypothetical protein
MTTKEVKQALLNGQQFGNEAANWYTVVSITKNMFWIVIGERNLFCKNIDSAAKKIAQLINRGY